MGLHRSIQPSTTTAMNKKHVTVALIVGIALGYVLQNKIRVIPVVNKLPIL